ncbi:uncharacterized protein PRCAT00001752001 [Priceomyces carsonii]|uniref:uncharacterized protein n=1 Tax=Priceomyces carsonii TaxID=28549 RepID=UPI002EDB3E35|nr:unnamed protein product [Priceomyces carsonii]
MTTANHPLTVKNLMEASARGGSTTSTIINTNVNTDFIDNSDTDVEEGLRLGRCVDQCHTPLIYLGTRDASVDSVDSNSTMSTIKLPGSEEVSRGMLEAPPNLVRKKSGELVKSSMKLNGLPRLISTSQISSGKSVRFASRLTNVKMFDGRELPSVVSTNENTPVHSPQNVDDDYFGSKGYFHWGWDDDEISDITSDTSSDDENILNGPPRVKYDIAYTDLKPAKNIYDKQDLACYLQSVKLTSDRTTLTGLIMVKNLAFEKHLSIKLSPDNWNSCLILNNVNYSKSFASIGFDQFKFQIPLTNMPRSINLEIVIKYEVLGSTFWDNNKGHNYHINLKPFVESSNTIKNYNYDFKSLAPECDELVNKLLKFKYEDDLSIKHDLYNDDDLNPKQILNNNPTKNKSEFHNRYNINDELDKPRSYPPIDPTIENKIRQVRPALKSSFSTSDILNVKPTRYSQSFKSKQKINQSTTSVNDTQFNSKSYSDLLQAYCFYNGDNNENSDRTAAPATFTNPSYISSPASTFNSLSDSIHL